MITNAEIKLIKSLQKKKERLEHGLFVVEGVKLIEELIQSDFEILHLYTTTELFLDHPASLSISEGQLARISSFVTPNQCLALVKLPSETLTPDYDFSTIVLENINDPGNLGTIIRTADWFGIPQIICSENSVDCFNAKVVAASMGSLFRVRVIYSDIPTYLDNSNAPSYGALLDGRSLFNTELPNPCNLVFGSESHGLSTELISLLEHKVTIPGGGTAESLNLSISTGIFCGEYFRQNLLN